MAKSSRDEWRRRVAAWLASGLSCREFAAEAGLNPNTLSWWKWKLGSTVERRDGEARQALTGAGGEEAAHPWAGWGQDEGSRRRPPVGVDVAHAGDAASDLGPPATFVEVTSLFDGEVDRGEAGCGVQVDCGGIRVGVPVGFDGPTLCRVLDILEARQ
jgi:hypothetical protein